MQTVYRTRMVKHTARRINAETLTPFSPIFNGDAYHAIVATGSATGGAGITGVGSPEGVQTATPGTIYLDTSTGSLWVKKTGIGNTGWLQEIA